MGHPPSDHHESEPFDTVANTPDVSPDASDSGEPTAPTAARATDEAATASRADGPPTTHDAEARDPSGVAPAPVAGDAVMRQSLDLDKISADLDGVEAALRRLDEGTYWTDEVTGEPIADEVLADDPIARRAGSQ